jgi:long-chain acyl-CoA synthetase
MAPTSERWELAQMGVLASQGVVVGLDPLDLDTNLNRIAARCELDGLILHRESWLSRFHAEVCAGLRFVIQLAPGECGSDVISFDRLLWGASGGASERWLCADPDDAATIIFTSGTTGLPKGILYTHRQLCLAVSAIVEVYSDLGESTRLACWLPLANLFQRIVNMVAIGCGARTYFVHDPRQIMAHVASIKPHVFFAVPRFYEKLYAEILRSSERQPAWRRGLAQWALGVAEQYADCLQSDSTLDPRLRFYRSLAEHFVFRRLRRLMGPNLRYLVSGSAPMPRWLLARFKAMGLLVLEAYGMSENVIPVAANRPSAYRLGTVGRPVRGSEVCLAADGELLVRGPGVTSEYFGEVGGQLQDDQGYLASGDYASIDADGFITITGRKSEVFKTATGRRIAPAAIEGVLRRIREIEHAAVLGAGRPFLIAVAVVSLDASGAIEPSPGGQTDLCELCERMRPQIWRMLDPIPDYKRPAGLIVTTRPFSVATGELTANLKLRRARIHSLYAEACDVLYELLKRRAGPFVQPLSTEMPGIVLCGL